MIQGSLTSRCALKVWVILRRRRCALSRDKGIPDSTHGRAAARLRLCLIRACSKFHPLAWKKIYDRGCIPYLNIQNFVAADKFFRGRIAPRVRRHSMTRQPEKQPQTTAPDPSDVIRESIDLDSFDQWAGAVKRQMVAALKRRGSM